MVARRVQIAKLAVFTLLPLAGLLLLAELVLRVAYFQSRSDNPLALVSLYRNVQTRVLNRRAEGIRRSQETHTLLKGRDLLFEPIGAELLADFKRRYEAAFRAFVAEAAKVRSLLVVLYIPMDATSRSASLEPCRAFFGDLARRHGGAFVDMTTVFRAHAAEDVLLLPENGHLSRFGNRLVATELERVIRERFDGARSGFAFERRPAMLGDLDSDDRRVWYTMDSIPFRAVSNKQGLRMDYDLTFPKPRQRILAMGDSFTFGPYLPIFHSYPYLLGKRMPDRDVANAGVAGYMIEDELELFVERSRYVEPDLTILQVLDNDLSGYFYFVRNQFDRKRRRFPPTPAEEVFFRRVEDALKKG